MTSVQFTDEDVTSMEQFGRMLSQKAMFNMSMSDIIAFHQLLIKYNQITRKVSDHVVELKKIVEPPTPAAEATKAD
jgi:hypothetical protein